MAKPFLDYLIRLAAEPSEIAEFLKDPKGKARENQLSDDQREALESKEWSSIKYVVERENPGLNVDNPAFIYFNPPLRFSISTKRAGDQEGE